MKSNVLECNLDANITGTSFHGVVIKVKPSDLLLFFGEGVVGDLYKTTMEWTFTFNDKVFCIYDWKQTSMYDEGFTSPKKFWAQDEVELHVGGWNLGDDMEFKEALEAHLFNKVGFLVLDA